MIIGSKQVEHGDGLWTRLNQQASSLGLSCRLCRKSVYMPPCQSDRPTSLSLSISLKGWTITSLSTTICFVDHHHSLPHSLSTLTRPGRHSFSIDQHTLSSCFHRPSFSRRWPPSPTPLLPLVSPAPLRVSPRELLAVALPPPSTPRPTLSLFPTLRTAPPVPSS